MAIAASFNLDYSSHIMIKNGLSCPNTRTVDAKIKIKSNRDNKEGRCEEELEIETFEERWVSKVSSHS